jgi:IS5 family transposase
MRKIDHLATEIYTFTDDAIKRQPRLAHWRRSNNRQPVFTDAEVLTVALLQPALGLISLKHAYEITRDNLASAFPRLPSYAQWLARLHALGGLTGHLMQVAAKRALAQETDRLYVLDSKPIPVCKAIRHGRVRLLREDGAYFGKTSAGWFFGFKLHVIAHQSGVVLSAILTPGNWDDRAAALALGWETGGGIVLGDQGYSGAETFDLLRDEAALVRVMPSDAGSRKARPKPSRRTFVSGLRQRIETTFSSLWRVLVDRVQSRSWRGLWSTIRLKLLHYNLRRAGLVSA